MLVPKVPYESMLRELTKDFSVIPEILWQTCAEGGFQLSPSPVLTLRMLQEIEDWTPSDWEKINARRNPPAELVQTVATTTARSPATLQQAVACLLCILGELVPPRPPTQVAAP